MTADDRPPVSVVAVIGGECSGKSTLARALAERLPGEHVVEELRVFVDDHGRPPQQAEQAGVMNRQIEAEGAAVQRAAASGLRWVVGDPAALMTAVYSVAYFDDDSLLPAAVAHQRNYRLTVWCDTDLPWVADGDQRDGPAERDRVHQLIGRIVDSHNLEVCRVAGPVDDRVERVLTALNTERS